MMSGRRTIEQRLEPDRREVSLVEGDERDRHRGGGGLGQETGSPPH